MERRLQLLAYVGRVFCVLHNQSDDAAASVLSFFFFNDTATTEIYTLSLHDALPIWSPCTFPGARCCAACSAPTLGWSAGSPGRSEEHTSELQSRGHLVCRLLLEKKKNIQIKPISKKIKKKKKKK